MSKQLLFGVDAGAAAAPIDPSSIAGMVLWLKANAIAGLNDGDPVTTWQDQSGEDNDVTQSASSKKPTYQTNELNGYPVVRFDGGDGLSSADSLTLPGHTTFIVFRNTANGCLLYEQGPDVNTDNGINFYVDNSVFQIRRSSDLDQHSIKRRESIDGTDNTWRLVTIRYGLTHSSHAMWINGVSQSLVDGSGTDDPEDMNQAEIHVGSRSESSFFMNGDIAELIIYDTELSNTDRANVEEYLLDKYGL